MGNVKKYQDVDRGLTVDMNYNLGIRTMPISHKVSLTAGGQQLRFTKATITSDGMHYASVSAYSSLTQFTTILYEYDVLGNIVKKTLPGGFTYVYDYGPYSPQSGNREYHGDYFKVIPARIIDPFGNVTRRLVNVFGQPVLIRDAYGEEIRYKYDPFNRLLEVRGPYDTDWTIKNKYWNNRTSMTQHNLGDGNIVHTSMLTDGLGRVIQVKKQLANDEDYLGCNGQTPAFRMAISGKTKYDEFGRVVENYLSEEKLFCDPLRPGQTVEAILTTYYPTTDREERKIMTTYDDQDRVLEQKGFGTNALTRMQYGYTNNLITQTVVLPERNTTISYFDKLGQKVKVEQVGGRGVIGGGGIERLSTRFAYDELGQLTATNNASDQTTYYEYDLLGRIVNKTTPASGTTKFEYDALGQIIKKYDANGNSIRYQYHFNRLTEIQGYEINATFVYEPQGRLQLMKDKTGQHEYKYGKLGEVVEDTKLLVDMYGDSHYFKTKYKYDSWGRLLEIVYPDREKVLYQYNSVGQLTRIVNDANFEYLSEVKYNYFDQPYYIRYGNKVEMKQEFDFTERLRAAQLSVLQGNNASVFSRNVYGYDKNNNVIGVYNNFSQHTRINVGGTYKKGFRYDAFNRLVLSEGEWEGLLEKHNYSLKMKYNTDHSIAQKDQTHQVVDRNTGQISFTENSINRNYRYNTPTNSQLTNIDAGSPNGSFNQIFTYDNNGNIINIKVNGGIRNAVDYGNRDIKWDANNNIIFVIEDGGSLTSAYLYDGKGERVGKRIDGGSNLSINGGNPLFGSYHAEETLYPSGNLVYTKGKYTKHYYANAKRIASRIGDSNQVQYFKQQDYNNVNVSPHIRPAGRMSTMGVTTSLGTNNIEPLNLTQTLESICKNQVEFLLNSLYNTPEKLYCRQQILSIVEQSKKYGARCKRMGADGRCLEYELYVTGTNYCLALEKINAQGCVELTPDGLVIDPETGYVYDPLTGLPLDPITREPIDLGNITGPINRLELDCYNRFIEFIEYYQDKEEKPEEYYYLIEYYYCLFCSDCRKCYQLKEAYAAGKFTIGDGWIKGGDGGEEADQYGAFFIRFCGLKIPNLPKDEGGEGSDNDPVFPPVVLPPAIGDRWTDNPPTTNPPIVANPTTQVGPVWWYHSDHLGSTSYITDVFGKPCQYIEYLPFGEVMVEQSTNNILENVYKFNAKELDQSTGYYYYGARYYDPGASIFLSVDPLADQFPGWNPYHYVHNNPINLVDPTGMSAQEPGDPVKQPQLGSIVKDAVAEMGTILDDIVINVQRGADKLASDWEKNKEKSGYNHFKNWKMEGMSFTMEGGKSSPWEAPKGSRFTPWVDMTVFMIFAMDVFGPETVLPGVVPDGSNTFAPKANNQPISPQPIVPVVPTLDKVMMQRIDYSATDRIGNNASVLHTPYPRDTSVVKGNGHVVIKNNTNDSLKAMRLRDLKNSR